MSFFPYCVAKSLKFQIHCIFYYIFCRQAKFSKYPKTKRKSNYEKNYQTNTELSQISITIMDPPKSTELDKEIKEESTFSIADENHVCVYLRVKSGVPYENDYEISGKTLVSKLPEESHYIGGVKDGDGVTKKFLFSKILGPSSTQVEVFDDVVRPKIISFINGSNCTLLTYGASGSGKTFTIIGTAEEPGLIPRALEYLFRTFPTLSDQYPLKPLPNGEIKELSEKEYKNEALYRSNILQAPNLDRVKHITTYKNMQEKLNIESVPVMDSSQKDTKLSLWVSFAEIYKESIYDLLQVDVPKGQERPKLRLGQINGQTFIKDLTSINVTSGLEAYQVLQYGIHNLNYASTTINSHSSRSHSIFTVKLIQSSEFGTKLSCFHFCDLAGSERQNKTMNIGDRFKESTNINTSLMVLGRCISCVRECQKKNEQRLVPFRESKITQLFQKALSGHEDISMIVNINPSRDMFFETQHVLNFSAIAKDVIVEAPAKIPNKSINSRFSQFMQSRTAAIQHSTTDDKQEEIEKLRDLVTQLYNEQQQLKLENLQNQELAKNCIVDSYKQILEESNITWQRRFNESESLCDKLERKVAHLKMRCKKLESQNPKKQHDSSDDEATQVLIDCEEQQEKLREHHQTIAILEQELTKVKFEKQAKAQELNEKIKHLMDENINLKKRNMELMATLEDAEKEYTDLESYIRENMDREKVHLSAIWALEEKVAEQETQLVANMEELAIKNNLIDELEDKNLKLRYYP